MRYDPLAPTVYIRCNWPSRREDADAIADRLRSFLNIISRLDDSLSDWSLGLNREKRYSSIRHELAAFIAAQVVVGEDGKEERSAGYQIIGSSHDSRERYCLIGCVGGIYGWPLWNRLFFQTSNGRPPNRDVVTYSSMKAVTLAAIDCWEPLFCTTRSSELKPNPADEGWYTKAWMTYVPPADAKSVDLVGIPFSERTANGGLLLSATDQFFDASNPDHVDAARRISRATQHLNAKLPPL